MRGVVVLVVLCGVFGAVHAAEKVHLELYLESLCPACQDFVQGELWSAWSAPDVQAIFDLSLIPYGNAHEKQDGDKWIFTCQHGEDECRGNLVETCTLHVLDDDMTTAFPLIHCAEGHYDPATAMKTCFADKGLDFTKVDACVNSDVGNSLEHDMAKKTDALDPSHTYVPWIVVNGVHTEDIQERAQEDLIGLLCDTYEGPKPAACTKHKRPSGSSMQARIHHHSLVNEGV